METITSVDGTRIAYERTGSGPPLVLVHGTTADHTRWAPVRPAFEAQFTVYAVDRRGRGASGDADEYDLEREFDDVAAVVDSIADPVVLLGHSYGALCSLGAVLRTDNVHRLVLYEPPLQVGDHHVVDEAVLAEMGALLDDGEDERALVLFLREVAGMPPAELEALRSAPNWPARVDAARTAYREAQAPATFAFDPARFAEVTVPTLLLSGSESAAFLRDATAAVHDALPHSELVVFDGAAHAAMNTHPDRFVDAVLAFLDTEGRRARTERSRKGR